MIVRVFKLLFVTSLTFERSFSQNVKYTTLPKQTCLTRPVLIILNPHELLLSINGQFR